MTNYNFLFTSGVFLGPLLSLSCSNWLVVWGGMELSLISLLPIMTMQKGLTSSESSMKYFLIQACASAIILFAGINMFFLNSNDYFPLVLLSFGLVMKLGIFPLHFWVIPVVKGAKFEHLLFLLGPMKVVPLMLLISIINIEDSYYYFGMLISLFSMIVGSLLGNSVSNIRSILGASSINHSGWFLLGGLVGGVWIYFLTYLMSLFMLLFFLIYKEDLLSSLTMLSLSGLPPFLLFPAKLNIIYSLAISYMSIIVFIIIIVSTLISLNFYLKFSYTFYLNMNYYINNYFLAVVFSLMTFLGGMTLFLV